MITRIYLIRHAEAEGNLYRRLQGQQNTNLTRKGRLQTQALAERFRQEPLDALWSSDLIRAQSTASAIRKVQPQLELHTDPALREVCLGCWEDTCLGEVKAKYAQQYQWFTTDPARWQVPGSESLQSVVERLEGKLRELAARYPGCTVAVVSHAFAIRAVISHIAGIPFAQLPFSDNTSVTTLEAEQGALRMVQYGDGSHLLSLGKSQAGKPPEGMEIREEGVFEPLALPEEETFYLDCYQDSWIASHGNTQGFQPILYLSEAAWVSRKDSRCLVKLLCRGAPVGLLELDPSRDAEQSAGWISLLWVDQAHRRRHFGVQLMGYAVSFFRKMDRREIHLHVSQTNAAALAFYQDLGFTVREERQGAGGPLYLLAMDIEPRVWNLP